MRRIVFVLMTLALTFTVMASTSFAKQHRDEDSRNRPHVVQTYDSHHRDYARYDRGHDQRYQKHQRHPGKHAVKVSRQNKHHRRHHLAEYRHHRQQTCNSYKRGYRDQRTTIVLPAPPIPRVVLRFPW
ncbi:hypothetical protein [uncultured Desulfuromonas sp.]|uniref:hypothetical protein n=1 Tax=uncultured Desulfuromonas sp. TaxID=181013 RepID=UPI002AAB5992|nr:hypothetical protein [uncultured Desulfuromonas sp.]